MQAPKSNPPTRLLWLVFGGLLVFLVIYFSLSPISIEMMVEPVFELTPRQGTVVRKLGHVIAYAALMFWFARRYKTLAKRRMIAIGLVVSGIALEFVQGWTGYRLFKIGDMAINAAGVAVGWALASPRMQNFLRRFFKR